MIILHKDKAFLAYCRELLDQFADETNGINYVFIATADGFDVASKILNFTDTYGSQDKLAAVASSIMALGISLSGEFGLQNCRTVTVDSDTGKITLRPINTIHQSFILLIQSGSDGLLGHILHGASKINAALMAKAEEYGPASA